MTRRELELGFESHPSPLIFRAPRNWTAVGAFGGIGAFHLMVALLASMGDRLGAASLGWRLSLLFGWIFLTIALGFALMRYQVIVDGGRKRVIVWTSMWRMGTGRALDFGQVQFVRIVMHNDESGRHEVQLAIVCNSEDVEVPPGKTPRQLALLLAMTLKVRLVKIYGDDCVAEPANRIARLASSDQENAIDG